VGLYVRLHSGDVVEFELGDVCGAVEEEGLTMAAVLPNVSAGSIISKA